MKTKKDLIELRRGLVKDCKSSRDILEKRYKKGIYKFNDFIIHQANIEKTEAEIALIDYILEGET